eukprot:m51a1_g8922 hypothetical protein (393) ;mRNA; r:816533-817985
MQNFEYANSTKLVFGKGSIEKLQELVPKGSRVLLAYGQGSIKRNGVYDQVVAAVKPTAEFSGIEPNPEYETLMRAVALCKENKIDFILAVGGGSVVDGMKFVAAVLNWTKTADPWDFVIEYGTKGNAAFEPRAVVPIGAVMTLPATGTETNGNSVISRRSLGQKFLFNHQSLHPAFSIIDPDMINSLPARQVTNGVVDAFVHVMEQYGGNSNQNGVGDEFCEGLLRVLSTTGRDVALAALAGRQAPYGQRADYWWATTNALSGIVSNGVTQCWATHLIGHEITAQYGMDHGMTLAIVLPALLRFEKEHRREKLARMAERVFGVRNAADMAEEAIVHTERLFNEVGAHTRLHEYGLDGRHFEAIASKFSEHQGIGAERNITRKDVLAILNAAL